MSDIPKGFCQCGCGQNTNIAKYDRAKWGWVKGEPFRYLSGHGKGNCPVYSDTEARFWAKVDIRGEDECWPWKAGCDKNGYGCFHLNGGKLVDSHRQAWECANKKRIPKGLNILHSCDNPPCNNPNHLFPGTQKDNVDDMMAKGRNGGQFEKGKVNVQRVRGSEIGISIFNEQTVLEIRRKYIPKKYGYKRLGKEYNTHPSNISAIVRRVTWTHI